MVNDVYIVIVVGGNQSDNESVPNRVCGQYRELLTKH